MLLFDSLALYSIAAYVLLTLITLASASSRRDLGARPAANLACLLVGTVIAYTAGSLWIFTLGWTLTILPFERKKLLTLSSIALAVAAFIASFAPESTAAQHAGFAAIALAVLIRKGLFPFHFWIPAAFESGSLPLLNLLLNSHLGAFALLRFGVPLFPEVAIESLTILSILAILTSILSALLALVADRPRRILALLCTSQAAFILAGLENRNVEGITGALLHWWVVAFSTTSLIVIYHALESRSAEASTLRGFLGFGFHAPRLAVLFAVAALTLVGLPGTLGFAAEDLLFHGALESHPLLGIGLPFATALNAITALRLLSMLFLGRRGITVPPIPDARPLERWALTGSAVLLVAGGLFPGALVALRSPAAHQFASLLAGR